MNFLFKENTPRWIILTLDTLICTLSVIASYFIPKKIKKEKKF